MVKRASTPVLRAVSGAMVALRDQAQEDDATVFKVGQQVGSLQSTRMWRTAFRAAELEMFAELRALPMETVARYPFKLTERSARRNGCRGSAPARWRNQQN